MGHAETAYPECRKKLKDTYMPPASCDRYCCGWMPISGGSVVPAPGLSCIAAGKGSLPGRPADVDPRVK